MPWTGSSQRVVCGEWWVNNTELQEKLPTSMQTCSLLFFSSLPADPSLFDLFHSQISWESTGELWAEPVFWLPCGQGRQTPICPWRDSGRCWSTDHSSLDATWQDTALWDHQDLHVQVKRETTSESNRAKGDWSLIPLFIHSMIIHLFNKRFWAPLWTKYGVMCWDRSWLLPTSPWQANGGEK